MTTDIIKVFYDLETTGLDYKRHSIHQIAGIVEVNGTEVESFDFKTKPHPKAAIEPEALGTSRVSKETILGYQAMSAAHKDFKKVIMRYVDPYDTRGKAFLVGFNNRFFDDPFLNAWFVQNGDPHMFSLFWMGSLDTLVLASQYLIDRRADMPSFKLKRVAKELGIEVDKSKLHNASYDVFLTKKIYRIVTGLDIEI